MTVPQAEFAAVVDLVWIQELNDVDQKFGRLLRIGDGRRIARRIHSRGVDIDFENFPHPGQKSRQFLSAQLIASSPNGDVPVLAEVEAGVAKSPDVGTFGVARIFGWRRIGNYQGSVGCGRR